jgi:uncharacterized protein (UPF0262 family)
MRTSGGGGGGGRESVTSPTDSLKSFGFGSSHDILAEDEEHHHVEGGGGDDDDEDEDEGEHISAAELTRLRTALTVAEEEAERLKDELAEALEDAALLKQLNDMDQLTIGSLTSGNHPHHVEANKQQLLQKKESMIEQESLNKKNMDLKQEVIRLKKEIEECNEKLDDVMRTSKREHEEVTKLKMEAEEKIVIFEKILLNENESREILENEIKDYALELSELKNQLQYQIDTNKELTNALNSSRPPRAPSSVLPTAPVPAPPVPPLLHHHHAKKSIKDESFWKSELEHYNTQLCLVEAELASQVTSVGGSSSSSGNDGRKSSPRTSLDDVTTGTKSTTSSTSSTVPTTTTNVQQLARQVIAKQCANLLSQCGVSGHMISCTLDEATSYAYAREVVILSKEIHIIEDHLIPCFNAVESLSQLTAVQASAGGLALLDEIKRQASNLTSSSSSSSTLYSSSGYAASSPVRRSTPTMTPPASPAPFASPRHYAAAKGEAEGAGDGGGEGEPTATSATAAATWTINGRGENGAIGIEEMLNMFSLRGSDLKDVVAHDMSLYMLRSITKQCKLICQKGLARSLALSQQSVSVVGTNSANPLREWFVEVALIKVLGQRLNRTNSAGSVYASTSSSSTTTTSTTDSNIISSGYMELLLTSKSTGKVLAPSVKLTLPSSSSFNSSPSMVRFTCSGNDISARDKNEDVVLSCKLFLQNDTKQDEFLGSFSIQLTKQSSISHPKQPAKFDDLNTSNNNNNGGGGSDGGDGDMQVIEWMQQWCGAQGGSERCLVLMRTRVIPSVEEGLKSELKLYASRLASLKRDYSKIYYPVSKKFGHKSLSAMKRALIQQSHKLNTRYSTPLEWWRYDISENDRKVYGMGFAVGLFLMVMLAIGLDGRNPIAQKCKAVLLLLQAALLWEACNYLMSNPAQEALKEWFSVDQKFVIIGATVTKVGITGAIFHAVLLFLGTNSLSGVTHFSVELVTPLLWVWFLGIMTGHLVFGRMVSSEVVDYLKVDMEEARLSIAAAEEKEALDLLSYRSEEVEENEDGAAADDETEEEDNFEDGNVSQSHSKIMNTSNMNQSYSIE